MNINILAVGKLKEKYLRDAIDEYVKRLGAYAKVKIIEVEETQVSGLGVIKAVQNESSELLNRLRGYVILLDLKGKELTSEEHAQLLDKVTTGGYSEITYVIGGSHGVDDRVREAANTRLCYGKATFPHQLMRVILAEQIYRSFTILAGTPYHK